MSINNNICRQINKYKFTFIKNNPISYKCIINFNIKLFINCMPFRNLINQMNFILFNNNKKYENKNETKKKKKN